MIFLSWKILQKYIYLYITMKCINKSTCTFEGFGKFNGIINGYKITFEKVFYSKDIKNILKYII